MVVFHGGHMRAGLSQGEDVFHQLGFTVLVPSRPGYGATPTGADDSPSGFADATDRLCDRLGLDRVDVLAISAGGPTGLAFAARHPDRVRSLILQCAVGVQPWPDRRTRVAGRVMFAPVLESVSWAMVRVLLRAAPRVGLAALLDPMSVLSGREVVRRLSSQERAVLRDLFSRMRSGRGFANDLRFLAKPEHRGLSLPALVIAGDSDGSVPLTQAEALVASIHGARLEIVRAESHLLWYGAAASRVDDLMRDFLRGLDQ